MEKEKFDPKDEQYKEVADLPEEEQNKFMDVENGFITKKAEITNYYHENVADTWNARKNILSKIFGAEITGADVAQAEALKIDNIKEAIKSGVGENAMDKLFKESKYYGYTNMSLFTSYEYISFKAFEQSVKEHPDVAMQLTRRYLEKGKEKDNYHRAYIMLGILMRLGNFDYEFFNESVDEFIKNRNFDWLLPLGQDLIIFDPRISQRILELFLQLRVPDHSIEHLAQSLAEKYPELANSIVEQLQNSNYLILADKIKHMSDTEK